MASTSWRANDTNTTSPPQGGYDLELFVDKEKIVEYICQICHDVSRQCVEVSCGNGHIFCNDCIRYHFELNGNVCPADRSNDINITHNDFVRRKIMSSKVRCKYFKFQCEWIGALRQSDQHIPQCPFEPINCKYCTHSVSTQMLHEHYKECDEYLVRCSWCKNMFKRRILHDHTASCYLKPVLCPNGCNEEIVSNELNDHLKHECEQRIILCPNYSKYGCDEEIKHGDINTHNIENDIKHIQYQMSWILAQNERKSQQIIQLQTRVSQLEGPDIVFVEGSFVKEMNGIYKKEKNWNEYNTINDEKDSNNNEDITRPYYTKYGDDIECRLYFINKWVFESKEFNGSCNDNALYPTKIKNNKWKINNIDTEAIKITAIDLFRQILDKIPLNALTQIISNSSPSQNGLHRNHHKDIRPTKIRVDIEERKTSIVANDDDKEDAELTNDDDQGQRERVRTISNASSDCSGDSQHILPEYRPIKVSVSTPVHFSSHHSAKWSISVSIKMKYDRLYSDLLRQESNNGNNNDTHHNPFGPPMVSNQTLYRYLTSVGYDSTLIKTLWKLINASNHSSNTNNLLTRNGFVAICHLLDKITNNEYNVPSTVPQPLKPQQLNNLISTPVHNERLNNTVFPNVNEFQDLQQDTKLNIDKSLLTFESNDVFAFTEIKTPKSDTETELNKQDFLNFIVDEQSKSMDNLLQSQTLSTPNPLEPLFMNIDSTIIIKSRTKPNTPNDKDNDFLSVFPAPHDLIKSKSLDSKSKSVNDLFYKTPSSKGNNNSLNFGTNPNQRNDLDDLWDQMNPNCSKK